MTPKATVSWLAAALTAILILVFFLGPKIRDARSLKPVAALVAIQVAGDEIARVGSVEAPAGTGFELYAVIEAELPDDTTVYLTEARRLMIGGREIPAENLRPFDLGSKPMRVLWFTIEGTPPFLSVDKHYAGDEEPQTGTPSEQPDLLSRFGFKGFLHPEWGVVPRVPGELMSSHEARIVADLDFERDFGTQRFQVWVEIFPHDETQIPSQRLESPGMDQVEPLAGDFPTVTLSAGGALATPSRVFGLTQLEVGTENRAALDRLEQLASKDLAFSRATVLRGVFEQLNTDYEQLRWDTAEIGVTAFLETRSGKASAIPGDLLQAGSRFVFLLADRGTAGLLDSADLCLDFEEGAGVRRLDQVFAGDGELKWARTGDAP
jgi:hypothetical protein